MHAGGSLGIRNASAGRHPAQRPLHEAAGKCHTRRFMHNIGYPAAVLKGNIETS
ncbi:hypothetical protein [Candidatus Methylobacter favarea]|uniref:hypothetical protein n=1 Tax=Candidatus Methylobacter favarea TaxID=2707345 RepID=UPI001C2CD0BD|nr:hypothetical protein [Candidatus Methylobacter favarea]